MNLAWRMETLLEVESNGLPTVCSGRWPCQPRAPMKHFPPLGYTGIQCFEMLTIIAPLVGDSGDYATAQHVLYGYMSHTTQTIQLYGRAPAKHDEQNGEVTELHCTYDPQTKGGKAPDGRKVKGTIHWLSATDSAVAEVRLYDRLFGIELPRVRDFEVLLFQLIAIVGIVRDALGLEKRGCRSVKIGAIFAIAHIVSQRLPERLPVFLLILPTGDYIVDLGPESLLIQSRVPEYLFGENQGLFELAVETGQTHDETVFTGRKFRRNAHFKKLLCNLTGRKTPCAGIVQFAHYIGETGGMFIPKVVLDAKGEKVVIWISDVVV